MTICIYLTPRLLTPNNQDFYFPFVLMTLVENLRLEGLLDHSSRTNSGWEVCQAYARTVGAKSAFWHR